MVDNAILAAKVAAIRDAAARIRAVLPATADDFARDRTVREVVVLNLFVALQECLALATHWLADAGVDVPTTYADVFHRLGERGVLSVELADRLAAASGFRNLIAHQYARLDWPRVYHIAAAHLDDLLAFADLLAARAAQSS